eukprot:scaffold629340_cov15-Prasinocladus_malaysianus.AAC.1
MNPSKCCVIWQNFSKSHFQQALGGRLLEVVLCAICGIASQRGQANTLSGTHYHITVLDC